jgi:hypothetical protein
LVLAITTCSPLTESRRVVLSPMRSTVPVVLSNWITSPRLNGLSNRIESAANRSEKMPCAARPMAMPPMPSPATNAVTLTPRLSRMTMIASANKVTLTSTRMTATALPIAVSLGSSPALRVMTPRTSSRAQIAPCKAKATMKKMSISRSSRAGIAA